MNPTNKQELRAIVGEIPNYIFERLELSDDVKEEWKHGSKASDFGSHNQFVQMFSRRIQAHTNAEIAKEIKLIRDALVGFTGDNDFVIVAIDGRIAELQAERALIEKRMT